jgi:acetylornithine deacetylase/succinyl-diaminopimelate desuccinylase-like protein
MSGSFKDIMSRITEDSIADLTLNLVKIHSETGTEQKVQEFYAEHLKKAGLEVVFQPIDDTGRSNVIGKIPGTGGGKSLMIQGHLDTIPRGDCVQPSINREESRVYGRGACDCKGSCAAEAVVAKALVESGVRLKGDLYIVGIAGEETTRKPDGSP